jgi:processive 1,2-diacylglycerol beta-glucosyltransferase
VSRRGYLELINAAPRVWSGVYRWLDRSPRAPLLFRALAGPRARLGRLLEEKRPVAVVSTYPVYSWLLNRLRAEGRLARPHFTVVTDALTINSLWFRTPSARWFVTDSDSAAHLRRHGAPAERIEVSGFPVATVFADRPAAWQPPDPAAGPRVLFMINSGRRHALGIAAALLRQPSWRLTFTAGRDERLRRELLALARRGPARAEVLGWTDRIPELLMTHHVAIGKAGGATTQESINALCPLLVSQIVPGQEEGNFELLRRTDAGALARTPAEVEAQLRRAFAADAAIWRRWRANLRRIARPGAARAIAASILASVAAERADPGADGVVALPDRATRG